MNYKRTLHSLFEDSESDAVIAETKAAYNIKTSGLLGQYKEAKKGGNWTLQWMEVICDFMEKFRNIIVWEYSD